MLGIWFSTGIFLHWYSPDNFISDWINSFTAIGTIGVVVTSLYLYKKTASDNYSSLAKSQRAYLLVERIDISKLDSSNYLFDITFKNSGITIATNIKTCINYEYHELPLSNSFEFPDKNNTAYENIPVYNCGAGLTFKAPIEKSFAEISCNLDNGKSIFIWGWLEYNDVYINRRHRTEFCYTINFISTDTGKLKVLQRVYKDFNNIDEACMHKIKTANKTNS